MQGIISTPLFTYHTISLQGSLLIYHYQQPPIILATILLVYIAALGRTTLGTITTPCLLLLNNPLSHPDHPGPLFPSVRLSTHNHEHHLWPLFDYSTRPIHALWPMPA